MGRSIKKKRQPRDEVRKNGDGRVNGKCGRGEEEREKKDVDKADE